MNVAGTSPLSPAASRAAASQSDNTVPTSCAKHSVQERSTNGRPSSESTQHYSIELDVGNLLLSRSFSLRKYPSWYNLFEWLLKKVKMRISSGIASFVSICGGWYPPIIERGLSESARARPVLVVGDSVIAFTAAGDQVGSEETCSVCG